MNEGNDFINSLVEDAADTKPTGFNIASRSRLVILFLTVYLSLIIATIGLRSDWHYQVSQLSYSIEIALSIILIFFAGIASVRFSVPRAIGRSPAVFLPFLVVVLGIVIWQLGGVSLDALIVSLTTPSLSYISFGVIAGAIPTASFLMWQMSQGSPTQLRFAGSLALLSASSCGHFLMRTVGQAENFADVLVWCYSPIVMLTILGLIFGQKLLKW
ncbi:MAG: NrsF family protein [Porticoccaceae bacterium]|nr:NrsF family protein [Porticoccaceae bacterium]MDG1474188.1 NrsF family protein [Porticoccaceae bacterium]